MVGLIWDRLSPLGIGEETCSDVLAIVEKAGMLPPFTYLKNLDTMDTAWEPEDE